MTSDDDLEHRSLAMERPEDRAARERVESNEAEAMRMALEPRDDLKAALDRTLDKMLDAHYTPEQRAAALARAEADCLRATIDAQEKLRAGLMIYIEDAVQACGDERVSGEPLAQAIRRIVAELRDLRKAVKVAG